MCHMWYVMSCHIISCHVSKVISYMLQCDYNTVTADARHLINAYYLFIYYLLFMSQLSCHIMLYHVPDLMLWHVMAYVMCYVTHHVIHYDTMYYLLCATYVSHVMLCHVSHMSCISCITCHVYHVSHVMSHISSHMSVTSFLTISHM